MVKHVQIALRGGAVVEFEASEVTIKIISAGPSAGKLDAFGWEHPNEPGGQRLGYVDTSEIAAITVREDSP
jgi:hypothetical protein